MVSPSKVYEIVNIMLSNQFLFESMQVRNTTNPKKV